MSLRTIGRDLLARDGHGNLRWRIATIFPRGKTLVTVPGTHATQRMAYVDEIERQRQAERQEPLSAAERSLLWQSAVDLILEDPTVLVRPDPENLPLALEADELLQQVVPKHQLRFLEVQNEKVREAIKRRGECWRITPIPRSLQEIKQTILSSRMRLAAGETCYYSNATGTRLLTYEEFRGLGSLDAAELRRRLVEIRQYSTCFNDLGNPEIDLFVAGKPLKTMLVNIDFTQLAAESLRTAYEQLAERFNELVPPELRHDDVDDACWREAMFSALVPLKDDAVSEELRAGLSPEFYLQIQWLPGGRVENGEMIFDSVLDEAPGPPGALPPVRDENVRGLIFNYFRDYHDLEYINVGRIGESLSYHPQQRGRRDVYVVEMGERGEREEIVKIVRMQKWGIGEHLDQGKPLIQAILESEQYTEYILDRRLGCRRLGMNLPDRLLVGKIGEAYRGRQTACHGTRIWSTYFERDYVRGLAADKIPRSRYRDASWVRRFAALLGEAAAPNLIVGRSDLEGRVLFDNGDEVLLEDQDRLPAELVVTTHAGTFFDFGRDLLSLAGAYATPVMSRADYVTDATEFAETYLAALVANFTRIQEQYRQQRRAFDTLFKHRPQDEGGFAYRWKCILKRLNCTSPVALARRLSSSLGLDRDDHRQPSLG